MLIDLLILLIIGFALEALVTKMAGRVFIASPTFTFSLLIVFIGVARWNLWGLIIVPLLPFATWIGGHFNDYDYLAAVYDYKVYIANVVGLMVVGINVLFFKKLGTKKIVTSIFKLVGLITLDYVLVCGIQILVYNILTAGNPFMMGNMIYTTSMIKEGQTTDINLCILIERAYVYNVLGLAISVIGSIVLRSQGVIGNVVEKLIDDKKQAELEKASEEAFDLGDDQQEDLASDESNEQCLLDSKEKKY